MVEAYGIKKWFVALYVDVPRCFYLSSNFGNSVGACDALVARHDRIDVVGYTKIDDALVFGSNNNLFGRYDLEALLVTTLHNCFATEVGEGLARKS